MPRSQYVVPRGGKWAVLKSGNFRATRKFDTQREAIAFARDLARKQRAELFIFGKDGLIRKGIFYDRNPVSPT